MTLKNDLNLARAVLILGMVFWMGACSDNNASPTLSESNTPEVIMSLSQREPIKTAAIPSIDAAVPEKFETATFGLGWFWGIDAQFGIIEGVIRTRAGYAGGKMSHPDYGNLGDHTETVQIDYDPDRISYEDLLRVFWKSHRPGQRAWKRQYMNAIFYHDARQQQLGEASKAALEKETGRTVRTEVLPLRAFYRAEDYHQKYLLNRNSDLGKELVRIYPIKNDYVDSTAVARVNGYVGGHGDATQLDREIDGLGLSHAGRQVLRELVRGADSKVYN